MPTSDILTIKDLTVFPLKEVIKADSQAICAIITTPHKGNVLIDYDKEIMRGWLIFGYRDNTYKRAGEIIKEIKELEEEGINFLINKWKENL